MSSSMNFVPSSITSTKLISTSQQDYETLKCFSVNWNGTSIHWSHHRACRGCSHVTATVFVLCSPSLCRVGRRPAASRQPLKGDRLVTTACPRSCLSAQIVSLNPTAPVSPWGRGHDSVATPSTLTFHRLALSYTRMEYPMKVQHS